MIPNLNQREYQLFTLKDDVMDKFTVIYASFIKRLRSGLVPQIQLSFEQLESPIITCICFVSNLEFYFSHS